MRAETAAAAETEGRMVRVREGGKGGEVASEVQTQQTDTRVRDNGRSKSSCGDNSTLSKQG